MALIAWGKHHRKVSWLVKPSSFDDVNKPEEITIVYELREPAAPGKYFGLILYSSQYQDLAQAEAARLHRAGVQFDLATKWMLPDGKYVGKKAYLEQSSAPWKLATKVQRTTPASHMPPRPVPGKPPVTKNTYKHGGPVTKSMPMADYFSKMLEDEGHAKPSTGPSTMTPAASMNENLLYVSPGSQEMMAFYDLSRAERRATYIGTSPLFKGKPALVRQGDKYPSLVFAQFDELFEVNGVQYGTGWHPFSADAFEVA